MSVAVESLLKQNNNMNMLPPLKREKGSFVGFNGVVPCIDDEDDCESTLRVRYFYVE